MRILVLAGGIGGARFLLGVRAVAREIGADVTAVVNTGDDVTLHGLRICPDLDSVMYTLGGGADPERGWGRRDETWSVREELAAYGAEPTWFGLGDRDTATHLVRTRLLASGYPLSAVTDELCRRWRPGVRLLPASDDRVETHVVVDAADADATDAGVPDVAGRRRIHFQEWWIRYRATLPAHGFVFTGAASAAAAPGVLDAVAAADVVLVAPSNPVVSIAPILAIPGIRDAVVSGTAPVIGVSPIIGGTAVRGMADRCLAAVGAECSAGGVARYLDTLVPGDEMPGDRVAGDRKRPGLLDGWLVDTVDAATSVPGITVVDRPLWMSSDSATAGIVRSALELASG